MQKYAILILNYYTRHTTTREKNSNYHLFRSSTTQFANAPLVTHSLSISPSLSLSLSPSLIWPAPITHRCIVLQNQDNQIDELFTHAKRSPEREREREPPNDDGDPNRTCSAGTYDARPCTRRCSTESDNSPASN